MRFLGIYPEKGFNGIEALVVSLIAIILVFLVLIIVIITTHLINAGTNKILSKSDIMPKKSNELLNKDPDAVIAALTATIDFNKETGKDAELMSIERIDD